ncbi:MAG: Gfo/Idh/MocA family oxidoreductase [Sulfuricurvum sp.]|jgi:hypothetical protein|nr:Gfo/Idh/MocA family oxidoreductase [Sulfuricurvum sp.]
MKFGLIGDGYAARRHKKAIQHVGGSLEWIHDPPKYEQTKEVEVNYNGVDYVIIACPNYLHHLYTKRILANSDAKVICEKPLCLPWEPIIDDDRINICMQLRYMENLPEPAETDLINVTMVRDADFFKSWKGNPRLSGGNFYEFFIHYIDLAILLDADFEGEVKSEGTQIREIITLNGKAIDLMGMDMQALYNRMYEEILAGRGIKPRDVFYLHYILDKNSEEHGFRYSGTIHKVRIGREQLC